MRLRLVSVVRAMARTSSGTPALGLPSRSSASACTCADWLTEAQLSVLMPASTAAGHSVRVPRRVCSSPLGSA